MAIEVKLPDVGEGVDEGTIVGVLVSVGDAVEEGQSLVELETDKAVVEVPSTAAGTVTEILVESGSTAAIGQVIVRLDASEGAAAAAPAADAAEEPAEEAPAPEAPAAAAETAMPADATPPAATQPVMGRASHQVPAAPSVRRLAREMGVAIEEVQGSGILGRISAADVQRAASGTPASGAALPAFQLPDFSRFGETTREKMSGIRKATVRSMTTAWAHVPMVTHFDRADGTDLEAFRKRYQKVADQAGAKLTPTAILLKIVAIALKKFPDFNASIDVDAEEIVYKDYVNIGVAVDTPAGLLVPVVKDADKKGIIDLALELDELAEKARNRKLGLDEMQGGNFSISNLGGIGGTNFTPIVNPPDVAILGVARGAIEPVWNRETNEFEPRFMMPLALTYDHRLIDGAAAARFTRFLANAIEEPFAIALEN